MWNVEPDAQVKKYSDGFYRWRAETDPEYERRIYSITMITCLIIAALIMAFNIYLYVLYKDPMSLLIVTVCDIVFLLIAFIICLILSKLPGGIYETYAMDETHIKSGYGRSSVYFDFKKVKKLNVEKRYLELIRGIKNMRVYVPEEDMSFVKGFITSRLNDQAEIIYHEKSDE